MLGKNGEKKKKREKKGVQGYKIQHTACKLPCCDRVTLGVAVSPAPLPSSGTHSSLNIQIC